MDDGSNDDSVGRDTLSGPNIETAYGGYRQKLAREARNIARSPAKVRRFSDEGLGINAKDPVLGNIISRSSEDRRLGASVVVLLACLGIVAAILNECIEEFVVAMYSWKKQLVANILDVNATKNGTLTVLQGYSTAVHFFTYLTWVFVLVLVSCSWVVYWGPQAAGSGIPEMKTMMAGDGMGDHEHGWAKGYLRS